MTKHILRHSICVRFIAYRSLSGTSNSWSVVKKHTDESQRVRQKNEDKLVTWEFICILKNVNGFTIFSFLFFASLQNDH